MAKNIQKNINSNRVSDTHRVAHDTMQPTPGEKNVVVVHVRYVGSQKLVVMLENINVIQ